MGGAKKPQLDRGKNPKLKAKRQDMGSCLLTFSWHKLCSVFPHFKQRHGGGQKF